jgi:hypothetical protein
METGSIDGRGAAGVATPVLGLRSPIDCDSGVAHIHVLSKLSSSQEIDGDTKDRT